MQSKKPVQYLFDFDSTFIRSEGLDELAEVSLAKNPEREMRVQRIKELTTLGMEGKLSFEESLRQRIELLQSNKTYIAKVAKILKRKISHSIARNKHFFKDNKDNIYIISGGFKELILPVVEQYGIKPEHVFANTFVFDAKGNVIGIDENNVMSKNKGKVNVVKQLKLTADLFIIGDGYTDYELKKLGLAKKFIAFTENVSRDIVVEKADHIAPNFDEFLYVNKLPRSLSYPKNRINVMLLENINNNAVTILEKEGYNVSYYEKSLSEDELLQKINNISVLGIRSKTKLTPKVFEAANRLLCVGVYAIGTNQIHLQRASDHGVCVFNAPYSNTRSVAEMIIGQMIMLSRKTFEKSTQMHQGIWNKSAVGSHEVRSRKLGIIGYGHIGSQVGILAEALGMDVYFYNSSEKQAYGNAKKCNSMEELLRTVDIVTVHVSGKPDNKNLINAKAFRAMRDGVLFLNASRGFVVDIDALVQNIKSGKIHGAAIDVFPSEPGKNGEPFESPLQHLPNVILTPHLGSGTQEAQQNIGMYVSNKIIEYINTGNTDLSVNFPYIQLPNQGNAHRLLHLHKNVPGILAKINSILADHNSNILGQYLKTNEHIGYVITDVDKKYNEEVLEILKKIPDTIRFRVLY